MLIRHRLILIGHPSRLIRHQLKLIGRQSILIRHQLKLIGHKSMLIRNGLILVGDGVAKVSGHFCQRIPGESSELDDGMSDACGINQGRCKATQVAVERPDRRVQKGKIR